MGMVLFDLYFLRLPVYSQLKHYDIECVSP